MVTLELEACSSQTLKGALCLYEMQRDVTKAGILQTRNETELFKQNEKTCENKEKVGSIQIFI